MSAAKPPVPLPSAHFGSIPTHLKRVWPRRNSAAIAPRELSESEQAYRKLLNERPSDRRVFHALARVLLDLHRRDEAIALYDTSARLPGGDPLALYDKALVLWNDGDTAKADMALHAAIDQNALRRRIAAERVVFNGDTWRSGCCSRDDREAPVLGPHGRPRMLFAYTLSLAGAILRLPLTTSGPWLVTGSTNLRGMPVQRVSWRAML